MDSTSGTSHSSHHSSTNSNHQNGTGVKRYQEYQSSNGNNNLTPQPSGSSGQAYRSNQYQMSPRSSRTDLRDRDRDHGSYSPVSHPSSPSLPYPPGSGPSTPNRPYSSQQHPFQYVQHPVEQSQPGEIITSAQSQSRPPYPYLNQPPMSPHSAGPNLSPGLSAAMNDLRVPQRSATDPQQWDATRNRYEDGGRSRSRTVYPSAGEDTYGSYGAPSAAAQGRGSEGLGLGPVEGHGQYRDRSPNRSYGVPGPGPNTERQNYNTNNLRIAPPSPSRQGRRSPNRSPTTPSSATMPSYLNVPLPPGSDQSHQSMSRINVTSPNGHVEPIQAGQSTRNPGSLSPTSGYDQGAANRPYDVHSHGTFTSTAPGPPVRRGSDLPATNSASVGTVTPTTSGTLTASNTTNTYSSTSSNSLDARKDDVSAGGSADAKSAAPAGNEGSRATGSGSSGGGTLPSGSICGSCAKPVKRQFVRAMGKVYHLDCFRCKVSCRDRQIVNTSET